LLGRTKEHELLVSHNKKGKMEQEIRPGKIYTALEACELMQWSYPTLLRKIRVGKIKKLTGTMEKIRIIGKDLLGGTNEL